MLNDKQDNAEAKEVAALFKVVRPQVHFPIEYKIRINKTGEQIENDDLGEEDGEAAKVPIVLVAQAEHRPPSLHADEKKKGGPPLYRPKRTDARTREHASAHPDKDLRDSQADNKRKQDREITEFVHYSDSQNSWPQLPAEHFLSALTRS